jgi:hypothetical protein
MPLMHPVDAALKARQLFLALVGRQTAVAAHQFRQHVVERFDVWEAVRDRARLRTVGDEPIRLAGDLCQRMRGGLVLGADGGKNSLAELPVLDELDVEQPTAGRSWPAPCSGWRAGCGRRAERLGATVMPDWRVCRVTGVALGALAESSTPR